MEVRLQDVDGSEVRDIGEAIISGPMVERYAWGTKNRSFPAGTYTISAFIPGIAGMKSLKPKRVLLEPGQHRAVTFQLPERVRSIKFRVSDPLDQAHGDIRLRAMVDGVVRYDEQARLGENARVFPWPARVEASLVDVSQNGRILDQVAIEPNSESHPMSVDLSLTGRASSGQEHR